MEGSLLPDSISNVSNDVDPNLEVRNAIPYPRATLLGMPVELRLQILQHLLPDLNAIPARFDHRNIHPEGKYVAQLNLESSYAKESYERGYCPLRHDYQSCSPAVMAVNRQIFNECTQIVYYAKRRYFEAIVNFKLAEKQLPSVSLLDVQHIYFPLTMFAPSSGWGQVGHMLPRIRSIHLSIPLWFRDFLNFPILKKQRATIKDLVDSLNIEIGCQRMQLDALVIDVQFMESEDEEVEEFLLADETKELRQACLKWLLAPFSSFFHFESGKAGFAIEGKNIHDIYGNTLPNLYSYLRDLSAQMCRETLGKKRRERSDHGDRMHDDTVMMMDCITDGAYNSIKYRSGEHPVKIQILAWDAWDREDWDGLKAAFLKAKRNWKLLNEKMIERFEYVETKFDEGQQTVMIEE